MFVWFCMVCIYPINTKETVNSSTVPPLYIKKQLLKQYRTTITPLASKQYSTYTVTIASFSCPPREATLVARDTHFPPGMPFKLHGYIYTTIFALHGAIRHGRYIFMRSSTSFVHRRSSAPTTYIYYAGYLHHRNVTERQLLAQPERRKDKHFMAKWIVAEKTKAGLTACNGMPEREGKNQEEDSPKQAGSCWFARAC